MKNKILVLLLLLITGSVHGQLPLRLPAVLSDHAVLQRGDHVRLWGWGPGGSTVCIVGSWRTSDTIRARIGADCAWSVELPAPAEGNGPFTIDFICGKDHRKMEDVLFGEVWLCSGQSNMEFNARWGLADGDRPVGPVENPSIRFFQVAQAYQPYPAVDCQGEWKVCDARTMPDFSSVGYFFGRRLQEATRRPVGLIGAYWGGTCIQTWMPQSFFEKDTSFNSSNARREAYGWAPEAPALLYNAMIHPFAPLKMAGVIWYQGEANVAEGAERYGTLFRGLIQSWRTAFGQSLPFYFAQIAPWNGYPGVNAAVLREQQATVLDLPGTGMVPVADLVTDVANIHPLAKRKAGERLADLALKEQYGADTLHPYAPCFAGFEVKGNKAIIRVNTSGKLLPVAKNIQPFQLAGADGVFYTASAKVDKGSEIWLTAPQVAKPAAVRYCFTNDALPTVKNEYGLPLLPFRTDGKAPSYNGSLVFHDHRLKILQFTDLHWIVGGDFRKGDDSAMALMRSLLEKERPDLVVFTGDIVVSGGAAGAWKEVTQPLADMQIPFVVSFGNHDTETDLTKQQALDVIRDNPYNLTYNAGDHLPGVGNCSLLIKDSATHTGKAALFFFDSHAYSSDSSVKGYDWIKNEQIQWYRGQSMQYEKENGEPLPSLAFFHIPLPEFELVRNQPSTVGNAYEPVCAPYLNSGLFAAFVERKDVEGVFAGHDHNNDYIGVLDSICLAYGRKTGYNAPYHEVLERGARVIELYDNGDLDTYITALSGRSYYFHFKRAKK